MHDVGELKDAIGVTTGKMVLLAFATCGLYPLLWLWRHRSTIDRVTGTRTVGDAYLIVLAACFGFIGVLPEFPAIDFALVGASGALFVVWAFKAKTALQDYAARVHGLDLRMNAFYVLLFTCYYINYCINDLPEVKRRREILDGHARALPPAPPPSEA